MNHADVYSRIKQDITEAIRSGELAEGTRVPSEIELVEKYGVARHQTRQALRDLEMAGWLVRRRGSGTYVAPGAPVGAMAGVRRNKTVALVFPRMSRYMRDVSAGFIQSMSDSGFDVITYNLCSKPDEASEAAYLKRVHESGIAGLVAWIEYNSPDVRQLLADMRVRRFPIVQVDRYLPDVEADFVVSDNEDLGYRLTKALIDRGHRVIAFGGVMRRDVSSVRDRMAGYEKALRDASLPFEEAYIGNIASYEGSNISNALAHLMARRERPTAIVCAHDRSASCVSTELSALGYRVPEDVELAAVDDQSPEALSGLPMLAMSQCGYEVGSQCAEVLLARIGDPERPIERRLIRNPRNPEESGREWSEHGDPVLARA
jgi:DNA-binding LacI/PurR family transcriptional regulator